MGGNGPCGSSAKRRLIGGGTNSECSPQHDITETGVSFRQCLQTQTSICVNQLCDGASGVGIVLSIISPSSSVWIVVSLLRCTCCTCLLICFSAKCVKPQFGMGHICLCACDMLRASSRSISPTRVVRSSVGNGGGGADGSGELVV